MSTKIKRTPKSLPGQTDLFKDQEPAQLIRDCSYGFRLSFQDFGGSRTVGDDVRRQAAKDQEADANAISFTKKLLPDKHPAIKKKNQAKSRILKFFHSRTLPYPEGGVGLLPTRSELVEDRDKEVEAFVDDVNKLIADFYVTVGELQDSWLDVVRDAQKRLGKLFNSQDYPSNIREIVTARIEPYNIDLPEYYKRLSPRLYAEASAALHAKFDEAARLQESHLAAAVADATEQLRLSVGGFHDGQQKLFRASVIENVLGAIAEFDTKCRKFGIGGNDMAIEFDRLRKVLLTDGLGHPLRPQDVREELKNDKKHAKQVIDSVSMIGKRIQELASVAPSRSLLRKQES